MMRRLWILVWKEVTLAFRDVGAIVTMLVTPLVLTIVIGAAFSGSANGPISGVPVLLVDRDGTTLSEDLVSSFDIEEVRELVALEVTSDEAAARARVEADEVAALVIIPEGFGDRVFPLASEVQRRIGLDLTSLRPDQDLTPQQEVAIAQAFLDTRDAAAEPLSVEIYGSPDWRLSVSIVKSIVRQGVEVINLQVEGTSTVIETLAPALSESGDRFAEGRALFGSDSVLTEGSAVAAELPITVSIVSSTGRSFSWISYSAASMSVLFLMFAVTSGGRSLLFERAIGTLPRLLVAPISPLGVLVGKMGGVVATGTLQMIILWLATTLIGAYWGSALAVLIGIFVLVLCASGVGALISAWSKTPGQASAIGSAVTLVGAAVSGTFFPRSNLPAWVQGLSLVTPNAWGIEIFSDLQLGGNLGALWPKLGLVLVLTALYYGVALVGFRRQFD
ncbi:MAG: ABC transporter permease [Anaerolineae bacterium]